MKKTKRFFAVLLSALLFIGSMPLVALADEDFADISYAGEPTTIVELYINQNLYTVNDETYVSDTALVMKNNRTMVPLCALAEHCGCNVIPCYAADGTTERVVFEK